ncbi:hypothetical protein NHX12_009565 [Muraenolepis orangiensis]|uniref:Uncharacterized protein n=1 Tax=Muraenolepis orangiensis TaxID=630683 RepID=A0A9Q0DI15_9TELE|nr:hypothetical protein NHX12_009565 [Muraenolepis orangiensis]
MGDEKKKSHPFSVEAIMSSSEPRWMDTKGFGFGNPKPLVSVRPSTDGSASPVKSETSDSDGSCVPRLILLGTSSSTSSSSSSTSSSRSGKQCGGPLEVDVLLVGGDMREGVDSGPDQF